MGKHIFLANETEIDVWGHIGTAQWERTDGLSPLAWYIYDLISCFLLRPTKT